MCKFQLSWRHGSHQNTKGSQSSLKSAAVCVRNLSIFKEVCVFVYRIAQSSRGHKKNTSRLTVIKMGVMGELHNEDARRTLFGSHPSSITHRARAQLLRRREAMIGAHTPQNTKHKFARAGAGHSHFEIDNTCANKSNSQHLCARIKVVTNH